jgi:hypothetical protein
MSDVQNRMIELMGPIDQQLLMCDDRKDQLMMACAMLQRVDELFALHLGQQGRDQMFKELVK